MIKLSKKGWLLIISAIVIAVAFGAYKFYKSRFLSETLPETVRAQSGGLYKISYDTLILDEVAGSLFVKNIVVQADSFVLKSDTFQGERPDVLINLHADSLSISGVETPRALLNKEISGRSLLIKGVQLELIQLEKAKDSVVKDSLPSDIIERIYYDIMKELKMVSMDTILVQDVTLSIIDRVAGKTTMTSRNVSVHLNDLLIDQSSLRDPSRIFFSKQVHIAADSIHLADKKGLYKYEFAGFDLNTSSATLTTKHIAVRPLFSESGFAKQFKTQVDRFNFTLGPVRLSGIDPARAMSGEFKADSMVVAESSFLIFRDATFPRDKLSRVGQYPHQVITKIPFPINISHALFLRSYIEYKEKNPKTGRSGKVHFNQVTARIQNLTNEKTALEKNDNMQVFFSASFLNMAKVEVNMSMKLGDERGRFSAKGHLAGFDATKLNVITEPLGMARVERGKIDGIRFNMNGDNYQATGDLTMLYDGLKVSALKIEEGKPGFQKEGFKSFMANMMLRNKNTSGENERKGKINNARNTNRSFFNLVWKSIFEGVKDVAGMPAGESSKGNKDR